MSISACGSQKTILDLLELELNSDPSQEHYVLLAPEPLLLLEGSSWVFFASLFETGITSHNDSWEWALHTASSGGSSLTSTTGPQKRQEPTPPTPRGCRHYSMPWAALTETLQVQRGAPL